VDQWTEEVMGLPHFFDQIQDLRSQVRLQSANRSKLKNPGTWIHRHFLLLALQTWWNKILPSSYGLYICLLDSNGQKIQQDGSIFLIFQRGRLSSFLAPDLSSMISERRKYSAEVVKFLSSKYLVPVQGLFVTSEEWHEWSESSHPWKKIATALKADRSKLIPFQMSIAALIYARAYLGF
jgi:hypothetical protein